MIPRIAGKSLRGNIIMKLKYLLLFAVAFVLSWAYLEREQLENKVLPALSFRAVSTFTNVVADSQETSPAQAGQPVSQSADAGNMAGEPKTQSASPEITDFASWIAQLDNTEPSADVVQTGIALAQARQPLMQQLIQSNPEQALLQAVSLREYAQLPDAIKPYVEKPFSSRANLMVLPDESGLMQPNQRPRFDPNQRIAGERVFLVLQDNPHEQLKLSRYGSRAQMQSADGIAVQGIVLEGVAAIHPNALQLVATEDQTFAQQQFTAQSTDTQQDFYTGETIQGEPVVALAGGKLFYFANTVNVERLNLKLAELERQAGPKVGSQLLFSAPMPGIAPDSLTTATSPLATQINAALADPYSWSATNKKSYFIRISFPDKPDAPVTQAKLESDLKEVSDNIWEMSHGKSRLSYAVNSDAHLVMMPHDSTYYYDKPNNVEKSSAAEADAIAALEAIDPSFKAADYDMVGLFFANLWDGAPGWASKTRLWIFDYDNEYLLTHEFGHCYGLGHAHFWEPTDLTSSVGAGNHIEYGDSFDFMGGTYDNRDDYHIQGQVKLGWLETSDWQDLTASGTYRINRFDHANATGNRALRISRGAGGGYYWLGHRQKFDDNPTLENGAYLIWQKDGYERSWLVDTTPGSKQNTAKDDSLDRQDGGIIVGRTYSDKTANIHITPIAKGGTEPKQWLDIQVNIGAFADNTAPVVSGINGAANAQARTNITFSAMATDTDGDTLAYQWDFGDGLINANTDTITHQWAVGGTYTVKLTVSDMKGGTASTEIIVTVTDPLNNWSVRPAGTTQTFRDLATDGNTVATVGSDGEVFTSTDGITWVKRDLGSHLDFFGIYYANGQWVAVGDDYRWSPTAGYIGVIYTSTDTVTWTRRYLDGNTGTTLEKVTYGNNTWAALGRNNTLLTSPDGITWTPQNLGTTEKVTDIAFGDGQFVAVAERNPNVAVLTSTNAATWVDRSSGANIANSWAEFKYIDYLHNRFIASGWFTGISYSTDKGITFHNNQPITQSTPANAYGGGVYFSAGVNQPSQTDETDINLISTDGMSWTLLTATSQPNRNAAIFFKNTFITVGKEGSIYQSAPLATDTTPDAFSFTAQTDVLLSSVVTSAPVQIVGIETATAWTATNGYACVSSGNHCNCDVAAFAVAGSVSNGQYLCAQHTSSSDYAGNVTSTVTVGGVSSSFGSTTVKNSQTITFGALGNKTLGDADFTISASTSSGLPVSFSSQTSDVCAVAGANVHLIAIGTCVIRASQAGSTTYGAAADVEQGFTVNAPTAIPTLTVVKTGTGAGTVTSKPAGIKCGVDCSETYKTSGQTVTLTAAALSGSIFTGWSGACMVAPGKPNVCQTTVSGAQTISANFDYITFILTVNKVGNGAVSSSAGIACGDDCSEALRTGTRMTLTATADAGYKFTGWSGDCRGSVASCTVSMTKAKTVTATFKPVLALRVEKTGTGAGTITATGIDCGVDCDESYLIGTKVTLKAKTVKGSRFEGWSGACSGSKTSCTVNMSEAKKVIANFGLIVN